MAEQETPTPKSKRRSFQWNLQSLMLFVSLIAIVCAGLAYPTRWWASIISTSVLCLLSFSLLAAVIFQGARRVFWAGFAVFGWMYLIVQFVQLPTINFDKTLLLPQMLLNQIQDWRSSGGSNWTFDYIGSFLAAIASAALGGSLALHCYDIGEEQLERE